MKYRLYVKNVGDEEVWTEDYDLDNPEKAYEMIADFNASLAPGERPRELVQVEPVEGKAHQAHVWVKTNLATVIDQYGTYDTYRCERCGVTGKRFGLTGSITRDAKYKAKKYQHCKG